MSPVYVRNGTPVEGQSLCQSCSHAHIVRGYRESEELVYCNYVYEQLFPVPFKVRECSSHSDKNKPSWEQMEKLAIEIKPAVSYKPVGFNRSENAGFVTEVEDEVADEVANK
jgi:hypothetical protein